MRLFTIRELTKIFNKNSSAYIYKLIKEGKLKAKKHGDWYITEEDAWNYKVKSNIKSNLKSLFRSNQKLKLLVDKHLNKVGKMAGPKDPLLAFAISKAYKTHHAIIQLCKNGYGEDATILNRTIFELLINTLYILKDTTDETAERYWAFNWFLKGKMYKYAEKNPRLLKQLKQRDLQQKPGTISLTKVKQMATQMEKKYKFKGYIWSGKPLAQMAKDVSREGQYQTVYTLASQLTHSNAGGINDFIKLTPNGLTAMCGISNNWIEQNLVMAFDFFSNIFAVLSDHFGWKAEKELNLLYKSFLGTIKKT